jgi:hypothetical protein
LPKGVWFEWHRSRVLLIAILFQGSVKPLKSEISVKQSVLEITGFNKKATEFYLMRSTSSSYPIIFNTFS